MVRSGCRDRDGDRERIITNNWLMQLQVLARAGDQKEKIMSSLEPHRFGVSELRKSLNPLVKVQPRITSLLINLSQLVIIRDFNYIYKTPS